ncbi:MAG: hypothetical protein AAFY34_13245 [Pseudomonadota bacterium]
MTTNHFDPLGIQKAMLAVMTESTSTVQNQWLQALSAMATRMPDAVTWKSVDIPIMNTQLFADEEQMREMFQMAADLNLHAWTQAANILSAMPSWMTWYNKVPGRVVTDMFHAMHMAASEDIGSDT